MVDGRGSSASAEEGVGTPSDPSRPELDKKARIRDNQRRSRARRQEHLEDLERRLAESHATCREAELQRDAFRALQIENGRLRDLLRLAGVNETLMDSYVNQGIGQLADSSTSLRQIRPRMAVQPTEVGSTSSFLASSSVGRGRSNVEPVPTTFAQAPYLHAQNVSAMQQTQLPTAVPDHRSLHQQSSIFQNSTQSDDTFLCDSFHCPAAGPLIENNANTILCSVAKDIIAQYNIDPLDMELIKARLATGFSRPAMPGEGCRVDNRLLFQILNEISSGHT